MKEDEESLDEANRRSRCSSTSRRLQTPTHHGSFYLRIGAVGKE